MPALERLGQEDHPKLKGQPELDGELVGDYFSDSSYYPVVPSKSFPSRGEDSHAAHFALFSPSNDYAR